MILSLKLFVFLLGLVCVSCASNPPMQTVSHLDLPKFMGSWRIIASTDNNIEKDFVDAVDIYALRDDQKSIDVTFQYRKKSFDAPLKTRQFPAKVVQDGTNAYWKVKLIPVIASDYKALYIDPKYEWAVMGHPSRDFGWILARERTVSDAVYSKGMEVFKQHGYDTSRFVKVPQVRE